MLQRAAAIVGVVVAACGGSPQKTSPPVVPAASRPSAPPAQPSVIAATTSQTSPPVAPLPVAPATTSQASPPVAPLPVAPATTSQPSSPPESPGTVIAPSAAPAPSGSVTAKIEGTPARFVVRVKHGRRVKVILKVPVPSRGYDNVEAHVAEVPGSGGRLALVQNFLELGEDAFSRDIRAWIIDARRDVVLWTGTGEYGNTNGACEWFDVPWATVEAGGLVVWREKAVEKIEADAPDCDEEPYQRTEAARIALD